MLSNNHLHIFLNDGVEYFLDGVFRKVFNRNERRDLTRSEVSKTLTHLLKLYRIGDQPLIKGVAIGVHVALDLRVDQGIKKGVKFRPF